jgi:hypothetical protein
MVLVTFAGTKVTRVRADARIESIIAKRFKKQGNRREKSG